MERSSSKLRYWAFGILAATLSGCASKETSLHLAEDGAPKGYVDVSLIPNAVPKPHNGRYKVSPYKLKGMYYKPLKTARGYVKKGVASWYGTKFHGKKTANGEVYDMYKMTAAHRTLPLPSYVKVTNLDNNRSVLLRVNDRGPFHDDRIIDLSYVAAKKLGFAQHGVSDVRVEAIVPTVGQENKNGKTKSTPLVYLQLAALKSYHSAHLMKKDVYNKLGIKTHIIMNRSKDDPYFRIRIGPVESPEQMNSMLNELAEARYDTPFVVYE